MTWGIMLPAAQVNNRSTKRPKLRRDGQGGVPSRGKRTKWCPPTIVVSGVLPPPFVRRCDLGLERPVTGGREVLHECSNGGSHDRRWRPPEPSSLARCGSQDKRDGIADLAFSLLIPSPRQASFKPCARSPGFRRVTSESSFCSSESARPVSAPHSGAGSARAWVPRAYGCQ